MESTISSIIWRNIFDCIIRDYNIVSNAIFKKTAGVAIVFYTRQQNPNWNHHQQQQDDAA